MVLRMSTLVHARGDDESAGTDVSPDRGTHLLLDRISLRGRRQLVALVHQGDEGAIERALVLPRRNPDIERALEKVDREIPVAEREQEHLILRHLLASQRYLDALLKQHRAHERLGVAKRSCAVESCNLEGRFGRGPRGHEVLRYCDCIVDARSGWKDEADRHAMQASF